MSNLHRLTKKFFPFTINIVDLAEIASAVLLVITGNNLAMADPVMSIISLSGYAAVKKFIEVANRKLTITPNPDPAGKLPQEPVATPEPK